MSYRTRNPGVQPDYLSPVVNTFLQNISQSFSNSDARADRLEQQAYNRWQQETQMEGRNRYYDAMADRTELSRDQFQAKVQREERARAARQLTSAIFLEDFTAKLTYVGNALASKDKPWLNGLARYRELQGSVLPEPGDKLAKVKQQVSQDNPKILETLAQAGKPFETLQTRVPNPNKEGELMNVPFMQAYTDAKSNSGLQTHLLMNHARPGTRGTLAKSLFNVEWNESQNRVYTMDESNRRNAIRSAAVQKLQDPSYMLAYAEEKTNKFNEFMKMPNMNAAMAQKMTTLHFAKQEFRTNEMAKYLYTAHKNGIQMTVQQAEKQYAINHPERMLTEAPNDALLEKRNEFVTRIQIANNTEASTNVENVRLGDAVYSNDPEEYFVPMRMLRKTKDMPEPKRLYNVQKGINAVNRHLPEAQQTIEANMKRVSVLANMGDPEAKKIYEQLVEDREVLKVVTKQMDNVEHGLDAFTTKMERLITPDQTWLKVKEFFAGDDYVGYDPATKTRIKSRVDAIGEIFTKAFTDGSKDPKAGLDGINKATFMISPSTYKSSYIETMKLSVEAIDGEIRRRSAGQSRFPSFSDRNQNVADLAQQRLSTEQMGQLSKNLSEITKTLEPGKILYTYSENVGGYVKVEERAGKVYFPHSDAVSKDNLPSNAMVIDTK